MNSLNSVPDLAIRAAAGRGLLRLGQHRSALLDCIRACAILSVLIYHVATRRQEDFDWIGEFIATYGYLGVDAFFPLSGFLITRFLISTSGSSSIRVFFLRRAFRILPLYFMALLIYLLAALAVGSEEGVLGRLWVNVFLMTGWFVFWEGKDSVPYLITWSISVEEFAYVIFGVGAWIVRQNFFLLLVVFAIISILLRWHFISGASDPIDMTSRLYYFPLARLDSVAVGGICAIAINRGVRWVDFGFALGMIGTALLWNVDVFFLQLLLSLTVALGTCAVIAIIEVRMAKVDYAVVRFFSAIGFYSYFNYLFHFFVIDGLRILLPESFFVGVGLWGESFLVLFLVQLLAVLSYRVFESPVMQFGRSLE